MGIIKEYHKLNYKQKRLFKRHLRRYLKGVLKDVIKGVLITILIIVIIVSVLGNKDKGSEEFTDTIKVEEQNKTDKTGVTYPFDSVSADWGSEIYEEGFIYYEIPQEYKDAGGYFPESIQAYLWKECEDAGINYYVVVALIERESKYKWYATGDNGNSKGYMQIYEKWHKDRMKEENVEDLYDPYGNIRVGVSYLKELTGGYANIDYNYVLMSYNMGKNKAKHLYDEGIYSTEYSEYILSRAQEITQEITQE